MRAATAPEITAKLKAMQAKAGPSYHYFKYEDGQIAYRKRRKSPSEQGPKVRFEHFDGTEWKDGLNGIEQVIYCWPELIEAVRAGKTIYFTEGEKDVDKLRTRGLEATTSGGTSSLEIVRRFAYLFEGATVVIIPDSDDGGRKFANDVARILSTVADVFLLTLPDVPEKGDVSDWLIDHTLEELLALEPKPWVEVVESEPPTPTVAKPFLKSTPATEITTSKPDWLIPLWLVKGGLHLVAGQQKSGKSTWLAYMCSRLTTDDALHVGYLSMEEPGGERITARFKANGADISKLTIIGTVQAQTKSGETFARPWRLPGDAKLLEDRIVEDRLDVVVIDGLGYMVDGKQDYATVGNALTLLADIGERTKATIIGITHVAKGGTTEAVTAAIGSTAWTAIPRIGYSVGYDPTDEAGKRRAVAVGSSNYKMPDWSYVFDIKQDDELEVGVAVNVSMSRVDADSIVGPTESKEDRSDRAEARRLVLAALEAGPMETQALTKLAAQNGISDRTLRRARSDIGVRSAARNDPETGKLIGWELSLPEKNLGPLGRLDDKSDKLAGHDQWTTRPNQVAKPEVHGENHTAKSEPHGQIAWPTGHTGDDQGKESIKPLKSIQTAHTANDSREAEKRQESKCRECQRELLRPDSIPVGLCVLCDPKRNEPEPLCRHCERYLATLEAKQAGVCVHHSEVMP